jgi:hypothetical protein
MSDLRRLVYDADADLGPSAEDEGVVYRISREAIDLDDDGGPAIEHLIDVARKGATRGTDGQSR